MSADRPVTVGGIAATNPYYGQSAREASASLFTIGDAQDDTFGVPRQASVAAPAAAEQTGGGMQWLGGRPLRLPKERAETLALLVRGAIAVWAVLLFVFGCVALARLAGAPRYDAECDDGNACTRDLSLGGGCLNLPVANKLPCQGDPNAVCYGYGAGNGNSPLEPAAPPTCRAGACVGKSCMGTCGRTADCPVVYLRGQPRHGACQWDTCVYIEQAQMPVATSQCAGEAFQRFCKTLLTPSDPFARCLTVTSMCDGGQLSCLFTFSCAVPAPPPLRPATPPPS